METGVREYKMPNVRDTMLRSLQQGFIDLVPRQTENLISSAGDVASTANDVSNAVNDVSNTVNNVGDTVNSVGNTINDVSNTVTDIKTALSSWDNCMNASFCK